MPLQVLYPVLWHPDKPSNVSSSSGLLIPPTSVTSNLIQEEPLNQHQFPKVQYWVKQAWTDPIKQETSMSKINKNSTKAGKKTVPGNNVMMWYIEDHQGVTIDWYCAREMQKFAHSIWISLAKSGRALKTWGEADVKTAQQYQHKICFHFPELLLCAYDWKFDQISTDNYPNWALHNLDHHSVKQEDGNHWPLSAKQHKLSKGPGSQSKKKRAASPLPSIDDCDANMLAPCSVSPSPDPSSFIQEDAAPIACYTNLQCTTTVPVTNTLDSTPTLTISPPCNNLQPSTPAHVNVADSPAMFMTTMTPSILMKENLEC